MSTTDVSRLYYNDTRQVTALERRRINASISFCEGIRSGNTLCVVIIISFFNWNRCTVHGSILCNLLFISIQQFTSALQLTNCHYEQVYYYCYTNNEYKSLLRCNLSYSFLFNDSHLYFRWEIVIVSTSISDTNVTFSNDLYLYSSDEVVVVL